MIKLFLKKEKKKKKKKRFSVVYYFHKKAAPQILDRDLIRYWYASSLSLYDESISCHWFLLYPLNTSENQRFSNVWGSVEKDHLAHIYLFKVSNRSTRKRCECMFKKNMIIENTFKVNNKNPIITVIALFNSH